MNPETQNGGGGWREKRKEREDKEGVHEKSYQKPKVMMLLNLCIEFSAGLDSDFPRPEE